MQNITEAIETEAERLVQRLYDKRVGEDVSDGTIDILVSAALEVSELHLALIEGGLHRVLWAQEQAK